MSARVDLTGQRFHDLVVLRCTETRDAHQRLLWRVLCDCGKEVDVVGHSLKNGNTKSCGCRRSRRGSKNPNFRGSGELGKNYWGSIVRGASLRGLSFELTSEQAWELFVAQGGRCALTGWDIAIPRLRARSEGTASLDRIDSKIGYVLGNVQWVHKNVNMAKQALAESDFIELCRAVARHREEIE